MKEYPYIGKLKDEFGADGLVLFTESGFGCPLRRQDGLWPHTKLNKYCYEWGEYHFINITKEYLKNKCVKILSPEHSEFVQKLAFKAGYSWNAGKNVALTSKKYLFFGVSKITCDNSNLFCIEEIIIPLPPKDNLQEEENFEEWKPVIGEKSLAPFENKEVVVTVAYLDTNNCDVDIALVFSEKKPFWVAKEDLKPLSKEDIILEEVITFLEDNGLGTKVTAMGLVEKFNIEMRENK